MAKKWPSKNRIISSIPHAGRNDRLSPFRRVFAQDDFLDFCTLRTGATWCYRASDIVAIPGARQVSRTILVAFAVTVAALVAPVRADELLLDCVYTSAGYPPNPNAAILGRHFIVDVNDQRAIIDNTDVNAIVTVGKGAITFKWFLPLFHDETDVTINRVTGQYSETSIKTDTMKITTINIATCTKVASPTKF